MIHRQSSPQRNEWASEQKPKKLLLVRFLLSQWKWAILLILFLVGAVWGVLHNPVYLRWRYRHMSLPQLIRIFPTHRLDPDFLYYLGLRLEQQGNYAQADPVLRHAVSLDPDNPLYRDAWARALLGSGLVTAAFGELRQFVGTHPHLAQAHLLMGKFYVSQRAMDRASDELNQAIQINPSLGEAWSYLAIAKEALGDNSGALQAAQKATALRPSSATDRFIYALFLSSASRFQEARKQFLLATHLAPKLEGIRQAYASWLLSHANGPQDVHEALQQAQQSVQLDPHDPLAWLALGKAFFMLGDYQNALNPLLKAYQLYPYDPRAPLMLRQAFQRLHKPQEASHWQNIYLVCQKQAAACQSLYNALRVHPHSASLHRQMAQLLAQRGDVEECLRNFAEAIHLPADSPRVLIAAANALTNAHFADKALPLAQRAVQLATANPSAHEALGNAWLALNRLRSAQIEYDAAVKWHHPRIAAIRKRIQAYWVYRLKHPLPSDVLFGKAHALLAKPHLTPSQLLQAETLASRALQSDPENSACADFLLALQISNGHLEQAFQTAKQVVFLLPYDHQAHANLAALLARFASSSKDLDEAQHQLALSGKEPALAPLRAYARGVIALKRGDAHEAFNQLCLAARLAPNAVDTFRQLATAAKALGKTKEAEQAEQRVKQLTQIAYQH